MPLNPAAWQRYGLWFSVAAFVVTRVLILAVAYLVPQDRSGEKARLYWSPLPTVRWDCAHYVHILQDGYPLKDGNLPDPPYSDAVAFFPLYPIMARPLAWFMQPATALVVLTHVASLLAMVFLYLWARRRYDSRIAFWCSLLLSVYPPAMFFSTGYADGLLVLWVAMALWLLDRQQIWWAAIVSALATATRPTGLCLAAIVVLWFILYVRRSGGWPSWLLRLAAIGLISIAGFIAYQAYLWHHYHRPDAFIAIQKSWATRREPDQRLLRLVTLKPFIQPALRPIKYAARGLSDLAHSRLPAAKDQFNHLLEPMSWNPLFNLIIVGVGVVGLLRPGRIPRILFLLPIMVFLEGYLPDPYRGGRLVGIGRYQLIALPVFLLLADALVRSRHAAVRHVICVVLLVFQCIFVWQFVNWNVAG